ncbi:hypothetical protein QJS66_14725 [Kocuria rhizophila]|nr:hypothetical protein QJS66_14725 [Kocuria rhizophila]
MNAPPGCSWSGDEVQEAEPRRAPHHPFRSPPRCPAPAGALNGRWPAPTSPGGLARCAAASPWTATCSDVVGVERAPGRAPPGPHRLVCTLIVAATMTQGHAYEGTRTP